MRLTPNKTGIIDGCFDGLHAGHLNILTVAREHCDNLIVCVYTDEYTRNLKGSNRPFNTLEDRILAICNAKLADLIVVVRKASDLKRLNNIAQVWIRSEDHKDPIYAHEYAGVLEDTEHIFVPYTKGVSTSLIYEGKNTWKDS